MKFTHHDDSTRATVGSELHLVSRLHMGSGFRSITVDAHVAGSRE
jgi:hypothetical protein